MHHVRFSNYAENTLHIVDGLVLQTEEKLKVLPRRGSTAPPGKVINVCAHTLSLTKTCTGALFPVYVYI